MNRIVIVIVVLAAAFYVLLSSLFVVNEREQAIVTRFGEITREIREPGLYFKIPTDFVERVQFVDKRLLRYDLERIRLQVSGGQFYIVDAFITYRIENLTRFREAVSGNIFQAEERIRTRFESALRDVYGQREFDAALSEQRGEMMREVRDVVAADAALIGATVVDVRILVTDLTPEVSAQTYERMRAERLAEAAFLRARGQEQAQILRAIADRQAVEIVSAANRDSEIIRGEGDAERNRLFAQAYSQDEAFFEFYRSMDAYRIALGDGSTTMMLTPDSAFFRFFGSNGALPEFPAPTAMPIDIGVQGPGEQPMDPSQFDDLLSTDSLVSGEGAPLSTTQDAPLDLETLIEPDAQTAPVAPTEPVVPAPVQ